MTFYYELFFDGDDLNDDWGTSEVSLDGNTYELCSQSYYVCIDEDALARLEIDPDIGVRDNDEMKFVLEEMHSPVACVSEDDLLNCVEPETVECLFAFREIDEDEYISFVG